MSKWIKKSDRVLVIAGNDKGTVGTVLARLKDRVVVQGVNVRKKHLKSKQKAGSSEIVEMEKPIHISNVQLCNADGKPIKLKTKTTSDGIKELYYIEDQKEIVHRQLRKGA